jgi:hypothetical protein
VNLDDVCAVILAGGAASRFGGVARVLPKCFLPVSAEETLLTRLLNQLAEAGFAKAAISTSPEWFPVFEALIARFRGTGCCEVLSNPAHAAGPLAALGGAARQIGERRLLLCLPDIFFPENPFPALAAANPDVAALSGCMAGGSMSAPSSGFLTVNRGMVEALTYRRSTGRCDAYWPGVALFPQGGIVPLLESMAPGGPIEELFAAAIAQRVRIGFQPCGPFGNVNTLSEWLRLLAPPSSAERDQPMRSHGL